MTNEQSGKLPQSFFILYDYCVPDRSSVLTFKKLIWIYWSKHHNLVFLQFGTKVVKVPLISPIGSRISSCPLCLLIGVIALLFN